MRKVTVLIAVVVAAVALPAIALGKNNPGITRAGNCSGGGTWKLKAKNDSGKIEVEFEVDQNVAGKRWNVVITRNGAPAFRGSRITRPPSGSFTVARLLANAPGRDRIAATARAAAGGRVCRGAVTI